LTRLKNDCKAHEDCLEGQRCLEGECLDDPPECGQPPLPDCAWGLEGDECEEGGGWIKCSALDPSTCWCECPSGDFGCPCWKSTHCRGHCRGDEENCIELQIGKCSFTQASAPLGCNCVVWQDQGFIVICAD
jgi:hypothetical protein